MLTEMSGTVDEWKSEQPTPVLPVAFLVVTSRCLFWIDLSCTHMPFKTKHWHIGINLRRLISSYKKRLWLSFFKGVFEKIALKIFV